MAFDPSNYNHWTYEGSRPEYREAHRREWMEYYGQYWRNRWPEWKRVGRSNLSRAAQQARARRQRLDPGRVSWLQQNRAQTTISRWWRRGTFARRVRRNRLLGPQAQLLSRYR